MVSEALTEDAATDLARGFKALGDPVRLRLLSLIAARGGGEVCVCDLTDAFTLTGPTISHHLRVLREAGLVDCQLRGRAPGDVHASAPASRRRDCPQAMSDFSCWRTHSPPPSRWAR